jgi:hypothetical protein
MLRVAAPRAHYGVRVAVERVKKLKDLMDMLERLPASPDRDRVLSEVRSRAVDLDTGVTPRSMLPIREPTPPAVMPRLPKVDRAPRIQRPTPAPAAAVEPARPEQPPCLDDLLSLEDAPLPYARAYGDQSDRPWTLGLRA